MDSTNVNRLKNTQASFTGKTQETQRQNQTQQTKDTKTIQQEIKAKEKEKQIQEQEAKEQQQRDKINQSQTTRINLLKTNQRQTSQTQQQPLYKQELQSLKGVLRNWVNGMLNPSSNFNLTQNTNINENATQRFVNSWLNADSRAIQNLERLLNLQLQLQPNNAEIYVKLQLVKIVKDAKKMVEEYADTKNDPRLPKGEAEENQHSFITAGMMATALNRARRKKNKSYTDIREELKKELKDLKDIDQSKSYYENITRARKLLKEAEKELFEAIKNGADQETVNKIIEKVADIYSLLTELYTKK